MKIKKKYKDEVFKDVVGAEQHYIVSNYGRVFSKNYKKTNEMKELKLSEGKSFRRGILQNYVRTRLHHLQKNRKFAVHRLVAMAFVKNKNPEKFNQVNHLNGAKNDNYYKNLEWVTQSENIRHAVLNGFKVAIKGSARYESKITETQAKIIKKLLKTKPPVFIYKKLNVSKHIVYDIKRGKTWKHVK